MKVLTIVGTRPELIRLSLIIPKLDKFSNHILVHTGQNFDYELNEIFFKELHIRKPDYYLNARGSFAEQISIMFPKIEKILIKEKPDRILILGDTNSSLCSIIAKRLQYPVFHMEAGNRSYDDRMPEEVNRKIIDHSSSIQLPYSSSSMHNLIFEGFPKNKIYVTGNPIYEILEKNKNSIKNSKILNKLKLKKKKFVLLTIHREENLDIQNNLNGIISSINSIAKSEKINVIWPIHPRSKIKIQKEKIVLNPLVKLIKPVGFFDFIKLEENSLCVLTDSGTVQEECSILSIPYLVLRSTTERPEALEMGSGILTGLEKDNIINSFKIVTSLKNNYSIPINYFSPFNSDIIVKLLLGNNK